MAKIQRDQVINAALALLDEVGLEAITTRKLAQKLGVESATLYWHFRNKASLLEEMAATVLARHHSLPLAEDTAEWADWLANNARSFRRALLAHRDGALLHAGTTPARVGGETFYPKVAYLMRAGFSEAEAAMILLTISEYTLGCVLRSSLVQTDMMMKDCLHPQQKSVVSMRLPTNIRIPVLSSVCL